MPIMPVKTTPPFTLTEDAAPVLEAVDAEPDAVDDMVPFMSIPPVPAVEAGSAMLSACLAASMKASAVLPLELRAC